MFSIDSFDINHNQYYALDNQKFNDIIDLIEANPLKYGAMLKATGRKSQPDVISYPRELYAWMLEVLPQKAQSLLVKEQCYWLLHGLRDFPCCKCCGKSLSSKQFLGIHKGYRDFCSMACKGKDLQYKKHLSDAFAKAVEDDPDFYVNKTLKSHKTRQQRYGAYCPQSSYEKMRKTRKHKAKQDPCYNENICEKRRLTNIANGHDPNWNNSQKMRQTRYEKNNGKWESNETVYMRKQHALQKYGVDDANKSDIVKAHKVEAFERKYGKGVRTSFQTLQFKQHMKDVNEQRKQKEFETKRKNGTFNASKPEEECYEMICKQFGKDDVIRQYHSGKYPFNCDFYIKSRDLYIECNFSWTHGGHWFDAESEEDQAKLQKWKDKGTKYYNNAIQTWTIRDVLKRQTAIANNLNYVVFWNLNEVKQHVLSAVSK